MTWLYYLIRDLPLKPVGFFRRLLTSFTGPELLGLATIIAWPIVIIVALYLAPPCDARDLNSITRERPNSCGHHPARPPISQGATP